MASAGEKVDVGRVVLADWQSFTEFHTGKAKAAGIAQVSSECHGRGADKMEMVRKKAVTTSLGFQQPELLLLLGKWN